MGNYLVSSLWMVCGLLIVSLGAVVTRMSLARVERLHQRHTLVLDTMPEGWGSWFYEGFADLTAGAQWMASAFYLALWIVLGVGLVGLGLRVLW